MLRAVVMEAVSEDPKSPDPVARWLRRLILVLAIAAMAAPASVECWKAYRYFLAEWGNTTATCAMK